MAVSFSSQLVEDVVQGVLAQLAAAGNTTTRPSVSADRIGVETVQVVPHLSERVITEAILEQQLPSLREFSVDAKAILTPSARDVIRRRNLVVQRKSLNTSAPQQDGKEPRNLLILLDSSKWPEVPGKKLRDNWKTEWPGCVEEAGRLVAGEFSRAAIDQVVVLARRNHHLACLMNRHETVRAAAVHDARDIKSICEHESMNVWCVNPTDRAWYELQSVFNAVGQVARERTK